MFESVPFKHITCFKRLEPQGVIHKRTSHFREHLTRDLDPYLITFSSPCNTVFKMLFLKWQLYEAPFSKSENPLIHLRKLVPFLLLVWALVDWASVQHVACLLWEGEHYVCMCLISSCHVYVCCALGSALRQWLSAIKSGIGIWLFF